MGELSSSAGRVIPYPIDKVWEVMHRTADLSITDGWKTIERISDSAWVGELQDHKVRCSTEFDEEAHIAEVTMRNSMKKFTHDTTLLKAEADGDSTKVAIMTTIRGGFLTMMMTKLTGEGGFRKVNENILENIEVLCRGGVSHDLSEDELVDYATQRVAQIREEQAAANAEVATADDGGDEMRGSSDDDRAHSLHEGNS